MLERIKNVLRSFLRKRKINKELRALDSPIFVDGFPESKNFGDALNISLVQYLSGRQVFPSRFLESTPQKEAASYAVIGSVCQWSRPQSVIWGGGFINLEFQHTKFVKPDKVLAVRGPLSRSIYQVNNVDCPDCYGDPALLMPLIYDPKIEPVYAYGIIAHYVDWESDWVNQYRDDDTVLIINIMISDNYELFVKQLKSCLRIVTSSLHGLILAQAYGVPVCLVKLSEHVAGGEFKFADYLLSVQKLPKDRRDLWNQPVPIEQLEYDGDPIQIDLAPLIESCPFIQSEQKAFLLVRNKRYYQSFSKDTDEK